MDAENLVLIPLIVGEASGVFAGFCPSWFTVSSPFFHDQEAKDGNIKRIRWGEVAATVIVVGTGAAITYHAKSPFPFWLSVIVSGVFVVGYEYMIRHPAKQDASFLPAKAVNAIPWTKAR